MEIKNLMVKKRILFLPFILFAGLILITLTIIITTRALPTNPTFIADPKGLLTDKDILFENLNTISGDHRYLAFVTAEDYGMRHAKVWLTYADGSSPIIVAKSDDGKFVTNPVFSPDGTKLAFMKVFPFQIWIYDIRSGRSRNVEPDDKRMEKFFNPTLGYGGETYFKWKNNTEIEFENNLSEPADRYTINIKDRLINKGDTGKIVDAVNANIPIFSQKDDKWSNEQLGNCAQFNLGQAGCAVSSIAMLLKAYGFDTNPKKLNDFLVANKFQGYIDDCNVKWSAIPNYIKGVRFVGAYFNEKTFDRLDYNLEHGNPVIVGFNKVPFTNIGHWVVVTKKEGNKYLINDPWSTDGKQKSLDDFGGTFDHLIVYEKE